MISDNDAMMNWENRIFNQAKENERTANIGRTLRELETIGLGREKSLSIISTSFDLSKEDITQELERFEEITRLIKGLSQLFSEDDLTDIIKNSYGFQFSIVSRMRDVGDKKVQFTFEQLKDLSNYKATANVRFIDDLETTYDKLMDLRFGRRSADGLQRERFVLFNQFKIDGKADIPFAEIQVHEKALPLLNNLEEWVRYSLQQFNELESSYSKTMFRLLKQYRTKGIAYFSKEDFHEF